MASRLRWGSWLIALGVLGALPVLAQSNFGGLTLGSGKQTGTLSGSTGGSTSLPAIVSNHDRNNNTCLGFGDPTPDHILVLQQNFSTLNLRVNSGGSGTTLVIQGARDVRCSDNTTARRQDASLTDTDWQAGTYKIWVGTAAPGVRRDYTLSVKP
ncbi:MAG: hypothetical protein KME45_13595 [Stenomitos rutilans HA7619-LM2]|nr:hypothetical protein [Stenomitos rutilans HA7619-LM2]